MNLMRKKWLSWPVNCEPVKCEREMDWDHIKAQVHQKMNWVVLGGDGQFESRENRVLILLAHFLVHLERTEFGSFKEDYMWKYS